MTFPTTNCSGVCFDIFRSADALARNFLFGLLLVTGLLWDQATLRSYVAGSALTLSKLSNANVSLGDNK